MSNTKPTPNNALMRHADSSGKTEQDTILEAHSVTFLQDQTIPTLLKHIGKVNIAIIHSPILRAVLTACALRSLLVRQGYTVDTHEEYYLRDTSPMEISGNAFGHIRGFYNVTADTFCILITHNPVIVRSLGRELDYCAVVGHDFEIAGHN